MVWATIGAPTFGKMVIERHEQGCCAPLKFDTKVSETGVSP
jgi:hypothetical protein